MNLNKKSFLIFMSGLLIGILLAAGGISLFRNAGTDNGQNGQAEEAMEQTENTAQTAETDETTQQDDSMQTTEQSTQPQPDAETPDTPSTQPAWDKSTVYNGGDEVAYNGKVYRAKWWTQGEEPGSADVWEDMLIAAGQTVTQTTDNEDNVSEQKDFTERAEVGKKVDFKVVGYFPAWETKTDKIQYDVLTHINYAFAIPTAEGGLLPLENAETAQKIIKEAHANDVKVFLAIGGWSHHDVPLENTFVAATETPEKVTAFAQEIVSVCEQYGFDGIDIDWEHPRQDGSKQQYEALMVELADKLHAKGKKLSSAVISGVTADGNVYYDAAAHTDKVLEAVDWLNVMAYDGGEGERHSSYDFAVNCGTYWHETRKMPAEKVVLGVPFYARPSWAAYEDILSAVPDAWKTDHTDFNGMDVWYNGVATMEKKTEYALANLGGIMIWEISQDVSGEHSLQTVIGKTVKADGK